MKLGNFFVLIFAFAVLLPWSQFSVANENSGDSCPNIRAVNTLGQLTQLMAQAGNTVWTGYKCNSCGAPTSARPQSGSNIANCKNCGAPHDGEQFLSPNEWIELGQSVLVEDGSTARQAASGPTVSCPSCGQSIFRTATSCEGCGASMQEAATAESIRIRRSTASQLAAEIQRDSKLPLTSKERKIVAWAAAALIGVTSAVGYWGTRTYELTGKVAGSKWVHTVHVDEFQQTSASNWANNVRPSEPVMPVQGSGERPGAFNLRNHREEFHHYDTVIVGSRTILKSRQVPYTDYENQTVSNGNGSFTSQRVPVTRYKTESYTEQEPVYEQVPRYQTKVDYDTFKWFELQHKMMRESGSIDRNTNTNIQLPWPEVILKELERARKDSDYRVDVTYTSGSVVKTYTLSPATEAELKEWREGSDVLIVVNNFGQIIKITPVE